jgi:hypothetical protein
MAAFMTVKRLRELLRNKEFDNSIIIVEGQMNIGIFESPLAKKEQAYIDVWKEDIIKPVYERQLSATIKEKP